MYQDGCDISYIYIRNCLNSMEAYMDLQLSSCFYFNYTYEVGLMPK